MEIFFPIIFVCCNSLMIEVKMNKVSQDETFDTTTLGDTVTTGQQYITDFAAFDTVYYNLNKPEYHDKMVYFLEEYFLKAYPTHRGRLVGIYLDQMNENGNIKLANEIVRIYLETTDLLTSVGQKMFNLPLLSESYASLGRVGQLADETASVKLQLKLGILQQKPVICLGGTSPQKNTLVNQGFRPYLEDSFEVITDDSASDYFIQKTHLSPYCSFFYKLSDSQYGQVGNFFFDSYPDLITQGISAYAFTLKDITINKAMKFLRPLGLMEDDQFVVLHLREKGYYDAHQHIFRNINPLQYIDTVEYFLNQGIKVVRIGHEKMTPMFERDGFIDLTRRMRPDEVDIFLCGKAKFYFGSASGPYSLSHNFGVPCCVTNALDYGGVRPNNFVQFLKFYDKSSKSVMSFDHFDKLGLKSIHSAKAFENRNLEPKFTASDQNLTLAREMLEYLDKGAIFRLNEQYKTQKHKHKINGGLSSQSLELLN